jgi:hypothetical protein
VSPTYASDTKVPVDQSRREIERTLQRYGATAFSYGYDADRARIMFAVEGRHIRFDMLVPPLHDFAFTATGQRRSDSSARDARAKAERQRWRALALVVKAKLEAVESGIVTFEQEFLAHVVLPDGSTVGEWAHPQIQEVYETGRMPDVLPGSTVAALPSPGGTS